jgi:hypothetical protein
MIGGTMPTYVCSGSLSHSECQLSYTVVLPDCVACAAIYRIWKYLYL